MGCTKQFTITPIASDQFTPLDNAVYVPSMGKILGTMENYVVRFNASTGAYETCAKAISPMYGPMGICLVNGVPWVSCWNDPSVASASVADHVRKDIFRLDTTTLEVVIPGIDLPSKSIFSPMQWQVGPTMIRSGGDIIYFLYVVEQQVYIGFIDSTNSLVFNVANANAGLWCEQFGYDGSNYLYTTDPKDLYLYRHNDILTTRDDIYVAPHYPVGIEWASTNAYAVCGDKWLIRADSFALGTSTDIDLEALIVPITGIKPIRLRYDPVDGLIYIPVQNKDGIVVYDPALGTAVWKSGFDSPVDVVFTPTKKFAVQSGLSGLKEIV